MVVLYLLTQGIKIDSFDIANVKVEKLYIKWDEKLIISIDDIKIFPQKRQHPRNDSQKTTLKKLLSTLTHIYDYFQTIDIKHFQYKNIVGSVRYSQNTDGFVKVDSEDSHLFGTIYIDGDTIHFHINSLRSVYLKTQIDGDIIFYKPENVLHTNLNIKLLEEVSFSLEGDLENNLFYFRTRFKNKIENSARIFSAIGLPKYVRYWVIDAINAKNVAITSFEGSIDLENPKNSLKTIYASAELDELKYTYNPKLAPVATTRTLLEFKEGVLYIRPQEPTTYGFDLQKSYLKIDFTQPNELLTLFLRFDKGKLDKNVLHVLSVYGIDVPLEQIAGTTKTDLKIAVRLRRLSVNADGTFTVKQGAFHYLGMDIAVKHLVLRLKNSHIFAKNMFASLGKSIQSKVDLDLQLAKKTGKIDFYAQKIDLIKQKLQLKSHPHIVYTINKDKNDTIFIPDTSWSFDKKTAIHVKEARIPFNFEKKLLNIPIIKLEIAKKAIALVSGEVDFATKKADIDIDIPKLELDKLKLAQSDLYLHLKIENKNFDISTHKPTYLYIGEDEASIEKTNIHYKNGVFSARNVAFDYGKFFKGKFDVDFNTTKRKGKILLLSSLLRFDNDTPLFQNTEPIYFKLNLANGVRLYSSKLAASLKIDKREFFAKAVSIKKLLPYSPLLRKLKISSGIFMVRKRNAKKNFEIDGILTGDYAFIVNKEKIINKYKIDGAIAKETKLTINDKIYLSIDENIQITGKNFGINLVELERFLEDFSNKNSSKSKKRIYAALKNGYLYISSSRRILYDKLDLQVTKEETTAQLQHKKGLAGFRFKKNKFYLYGSGFSDVFMDNLFFQSKFKGGKLNFNIIGTFEKYKGIIEITNTTILDYKILNNILAFIDTVPSLMTFSLPKYSTEGLDVSKAYASFSYENQVFDFDNIKLDSPQFEIYGKGKASYTENFIDLILVLKTRLADKASKIPLVGYIFFDGESISTTLTVKGSLTDPKVSTMIAKDIAVAPLNIIKRTLLLPVKIFGFDEK